mmetsp:Transcript_91887/g.230968  ORF Transcript_91887/g.230968 Transcript_91887/m.230968 type:complete len:546 (+) Transcript_91887:226-1863(+)|eukprot:CAMPEP_0115227690 /NCGR_PEP_ID=MMETSP0270-20121206/31275_1 /TAXON_ID=71861 /ORGANISM="Scrippsiella trochoidea, Strain CCMP3099" /LENGTH=545 /DNA_ID=CAMNT_0002642149 /DNA_START=158 /DNA_END=1795 /DNA_ORIENTATION=-
MAAYPTPLFPLPPEGRRVELRWIGGPGGCHLELACKADGPVVVDLVSCEPEVIDWHPAANARPNGTGPVGCVGSPGAGAGAAEDGAAELSAEAAAAAAAEAELGAGAGLGAEAGAAELGAGRLGAGDGLGARAAVAAAPAACCTPAAATAAVAAADVVHLQSPAAAAAATTSALEMRVTTPPVAWGALPRPPEVTTKQVQQFQDTSGNEDSKYQVTNDKSSMPTVGVKQGSGVVEDDTEDVAVGDGKTVQHVDESVNADRSQVVNGENSIKYQVNNGKNSMPDPREHLDQDPMKDLDQDDAVDRSGMSVQHVVGHLQGDKKMEVKTQVTNDKNSMPADGAAIGSVVDAKAQVACDATSKLGQDSTKDCSKDDVVDRGGKSVQLGDGKMGTVEPQVTNGKNSMPASSSKMGDAKAQVACDVTSKLGRDPMKDCSKDVAGDRGGKPVHLGDGKMGTVKAQARNGRNSMPASSSKLGHATTSLNSYEALGEALVDDEDSAEAIGCNDAVRLIQEFNLASNEEERLEILPRLKASLVAAGLDYLFESVT